jgi:hypothetical protein
MRILTARPTDVPKVAALLRSSPGVWQSSWRSDSVTLLCRDVGVDNAA